MISVQEALDKILALAQPVKALHPQPPFPSSAMDGYAVADPDPAPGTRFPVIGESAAGRAFDRAVSPGEAVRIFTGAPIPEGAARIIIQEDTEREGDTITLREGLDSPTYIRPEGSDFPADFTVDAPRRLSPNDVALLASMGAGQITVRKRPTVAILATGDELVAPGTTPGPDQIMASNNYGLHALLTTRGAAPRLLPIARDTAASLSLSFDLAADADLILTIGGASVGDYDLVGDIAAERGLDRAFYKVAMRPGKPLMAGRIGASAMIGLPGNPVSAMVCGTIFVRPLIDAMLGLSAGPAPREDTPLAHPIPANGPREHYMRARLSGGTVEVFDRQDSSLLRVLTEANALVVRPPNAPACGAGATVPTIRL